MCAASEFSSPRVGSTLLGVIVFPSDSLKPLWVLGALDDQSLSYASLEEEYLLNGYSGVLCGTTAGHRIDPQIHLLGSQSPEDTLWLEGPNIPCSLELNNSISHFTSK